MQNQNPFVLFKSEAPKVAAAFDGLIDAVSSQSGLDAKTRQLIYIGIKASHGDAGAVTAHVLMAKSHGATRDEIRDTILLTLTVSTAQGRTALCSPTRKR